MHALVTKQGLINKKPTHANDLSHQGSSLESNCFHINPTVFTSSTPTSKFVQQPTCNIHTSTYLISKLLQVQTFTLISL